MKKYLKYTWADMANVIDMKTVYSEIVESKEISVPKNRKDLTKETALWFVDNAHKFNKKNSPAYQKVLEIVQAYLESCNVNKKV